MTDSPPPEPPRSPHRGGRVLGPRVKVAVAVVVAAVVVAAVAFGLVLVTAGDDDMGESLTPETAEAGQCVDITEEAGRIAITEADCGEGHDAEIVLTTQVGDTLEGSAGLGDAEGVCTDLMEPDDVTRLADHGPLEWGLLIDEPSNIDPFDRLVCYVSDPDGPLTDPLLD